MKIKNILIALFSVLLIVGVAWGGYGMMRDMQQKKMRYEADLFSLVPLEAKALVYFHNTQTFFADPFVKTASATVWDDLLNGLIVNEALLSLHPEGAVLYIKASPEEMEPLLAPVMSDFDAHTINENGTEVSVITLTDDRFFCYFYHQGVWIGSLRKRLLDRVATHLAEGKSLRGDSLFVAALNGLGMKVAANIVINTDSTDYFRDPSNPEAFIHPIKKWVGCDLSTVGGKLWFSGVIGAGFADEEGVESEVSTLNDNLIPTSSYLLCKPYESAVHYVWFCPEDSVDFTGRVALTATDFLEPDAKKLPGVVFYRDYLVLADSLAVVDAFIASLKRDSINNVQEQGFLADLNVTVECGFEADMAMLFSVSTPDFLPSWMDNREALSSYNLRYYTYFEDGKHLFNLILTPKQQLF